MKKGMFIVSILIVAILVIGVFTGYCADSPSQDVAKRKQQIQKGFDGGKRGFMKWGADINSFPHLALKDADPQLPELKRYDDPELSEQMEKITRMFGTPPMPLFYIFYENIFCGIEMQGLEFKKAEEFQNFKYGHWTHLENLPRPYYGRCWRIGKIDVSLIGSTGESWGSLFINYTPLTNKYMPKMKEK